MAAFKFHAPPRRALFSDDELLASLRRFSRDSRLRFFTQDQFDRWKRRPFRAETIRNRFGSWRQGLRVAGLEAPIRTRYDPAKLLAEVERIWKRLGHPPSTSDLVRLAKYPAQAFHRRFGSISNLCHRLALHHKGRLSRKVILSQAVERPRLPSDKVRFRVMQRDCFRCTICGASPANDPRVVLQVDHIKPLSRGGTNHESNLRCVCQKCNLGRRRLKGAHRPRAR